MNMLKGDLGDVSLWESLSLNYWKPYFPISYSVEINFKEKSVLEKKIYLISMSDKSYIQIE